MAEDFLEKVPRNSPLRPMVVKLGEYIEDAAQLGPSIILKPKKASFDSLILGGEFKLFKKRFVFSCNVRIRGREEMNEESKDLYRRLKPLECEAFRIRGEGRMAFREHGLLRELKPFIPDLNPNPILADALNADEGLMKVIDEIKPIHLSISLVSLTPEETLFLPAPKTAILKASARYYKNPLEITYSITLVTSAGKASLAPKIYRLLDAIAHSCIKVSSTISENR